MPRAPDYQRERGQRQEKRILESLAESGKTSEQLAEALAMGRSNVEIYMRRMRKDGQIHIADHQRNTTGRPAPIWGLGNGKNAEFVPRRISTPVQSIAERLEIARKVLKVGHTSKELGVKMCVSKSRAQKYIQMMREGGEAVYIDGWRHPGHRGDLAPIYRMGKKKDMPKPKQTRKERYEAEKANPDRYERILKKNRARHAVDRAKKKPRGIFDALGV